MDCFCTNLLHYLFPTCAREKMEKCVFFVVIGVATRSVVSVAPRCEENTAVIGALFLGHENEKIILNDGSGIHNVRMCGYVNKATLFFVSVSRQKTPGDT